MVISEENLENHLVAQLSLEIASGAGEMAESVKVEGAMTISG